ncbi:hypothetical protein KIN20_013159 [Parelaphostrongylus tenuis]|uniref:Uncharacterized protein n=1 Tax=Parelaphostrongylus tenuis TaxID=148309 RepID=A0AAD5MBR5_PARTN|nr:hypothetical protein KIN20_013159 [Parelaphostrongylus tenuis]
MEELDQEMQREENKELRILRLLLKGLHNGWRTYKELLTASFAHRKTFNYLITFKFIKGDA